MICDGAWKSGVVVLFLFILPRRTTFSSLHIFAPFLSTTLASHMYIGCSVNDESFIEYHLKFP